MLFAAVVALSLSAAPPRPFIQGPSVEGITEYRLPNGLKVLLVPDASKATVTVNLTVFVGSRHENYGETGMAHLFEHMLFKETKRFKDVKKALTEHGADANGTTWLDRTNYFETMPSTDENLKWAIELESDRLVDAVISREKLATEMTVVRNELEMGENNPTRVLLQRVMRAGHSWHNYGNSTIGAQSDIENVPTERLVAFYKHHYQPDNAMLVIAGKFDEAKTLGWVAKAFGRIPKPRRTLTPTYTVEPPQDGERSVTVRRVGGTPVLMAGYHIPAGTDPDAAAIDVLDAILSDTPSGRLYKSMVETKQAARIGCYTFQLREPGYITCLAILKDGDPVALARETLVTTIETMGQQPITAADVDRAKIMLLKNYELELNSSDRIGITLSESAATSDWRHFFLHRDRLKQVTAEDVKRVAQRYFQRTNRTFGEYVPSPTGNRVEVPAMADLSKVYDDYKGGEAVAKGEAFDASPANIQARTAVVKLANGAQLALLAKKTRGETVHAAVYVRYGDDKSLTGLRTVNDFTARMLSRGTKRLTRQQFADALDKLNAVVSFNPTPQGVLATVEVRRPALDETLGLVFEALKTPRFDAEELESLRREVLTRAEQDKDDPRALGFNAAQRMVSRWPKGHPLAIPTIPEIIEESRAVTLQQLAAHHAKAYGGDKALVSVVGDFETKAMEAKLKGQLVGWKTNLAWAPIDQPYQATEKRLEEIATPDKKMAFFATGLTFSMKDTSPDYPALTLANYMLGGGFLSGRVPQRLREKEGLSYGAGTMLRVNDQGDHSVMLGYAIYAPQNVEKVEQGFLEEVTKAVASGFTAEELKQARAGLLQQREQQRSDDGSLSMTLVDHLELGRTMTYEAKVDATLAKLTLDDVGGALKKYVDPAKLSIVKAGDFKKIAAPK